ncbi:unnamed protein product [Victoria cruziana]
MELLRSYAQLPEFMAGSGAPGPACPRGARFGAPTPIPCRGPSMSTEFRPPFLVKKTNVGLTSRHVTLLDYRPADLVVDNRSDLVKVVVAPVVGQRTYRDARRPIYDVSVTDVRQVGHVGWPGSSPANGTSIPKPSEYLFDRRLYSYGEFAVERSHPMSPSFPRRLLTRGSIQ